MKRITVFIVYFFCLHYCGYSQDRFIVQNAKQSDKVKFQLINNLIIIPVEINGVNLSFLLDSGVTKPILFNFLNVSDSLKIESTETFYLRGLGEDEHILAQRSTGNVFKIGDAVKLDQDMYAIYDANLNLAPKLGVPVHGIIGFDLLKDLVIEVNYSRSFLKLYNPDNYKYKRCRKCEIFHLEFYNNKPYINGVVELNERSIPVKLLIDTGGSDALWLFEDETKGINAGANYFHDFLGHGLGGSVYGKRSKVEALHLKNFTLKKPNVAYPDSLFIMHAKNHKERSGSVSGNILKRFNIILDYRNATISLKKNGSFNHDFNYNNSGIELAHDGYKFVKQTKDILYNQSGNDEESISQGLNILYRTDVKMVLKPVYTIVELRKNSPAERIGLKLNDVVVSINGKVTHHYKLQKLMEMFYDDPGKNIRLKVERNGIPLTFSFNLENPLKK
ncbi:aspartyl protease family protein [Aestuariibaculum sediminum]|uniref:PDZ domain-containing protein n=1 Tax=Aestuariibaculum sediminum TaxID=2770637 RepID=A0A8J6Q752_9FLAO|nr:PDZ domain-containing protein [Aestuariibaculum sediminum]MBD0832368.1 PDZ domain-containing protein [Aestuariibaculum sediminum]